MRLLSMLLVAAALQASGAALAQTAKPAAPPPADTTEIISVRGNELTAAGIQKITASATKGARAIRVDSPWGASYFNWPKDVKPVAFTIETGAGGTAILRAAGYTEANRADYKAAIDAVVPIAKEKTQDNKALKDHTLQKK